ncbi:hypothetical protein DMB66_14310 [Actinoplanes sp. ATCC 53533]|uniref:hypothetical protein n=1 Tax=Actinoplanes sp. ATCC 53533 TaxID=1288362 RepID=UPI000F7AA225|nr:hypothetical protein [Actinoplanes sp. ATCC 53533]RSM68082.1 hypothetical protein DMB66_14310 [Actinoplanes sp. ATCC 53533]
MDDREKIKTEWEARARAGDRVRNTAAAGAINRYLGSFSYLDAYVDREVAAEPAQAATIEKR